MSSKLRLLITLVDGYRNTLVRVALEVACDQLSGDCAVYWAEPENRKQLVALLPAHISNGRGIVEVSEIEHVVVIE